MMIGRPSVSSFQRVGVRAAGCRLPAWGRVRPDPPLDRPDVPVPHHPPPPHPQALVLRHRRQAPAATSRKRRWASVPGTRRPRPGRGRSAGIGAAGPVRVGSWLAYHQAPQDDHQPNRSVTLCRTRTPAHPGFLVSTCPSRIGRAFAHQRGIKVPGIRGTLAPNSSP
jgi:hypothetical protein